MNIGTGNGTDVNELEALLRRAVAATKPGSPPLPEPLHGPARPGDLRSNLVDAALAGRVLDWRPTVPLAEGLALSAAWFAGRARSS
jgi:UDP-glucose 4-epimerase